MKGLLFIFSVLNWAEMLESLRTGKPHPGQRGNTGKKIKNSPKTHAAGGAGGVSTGGWPSAWRPGWRAGFSSWLCLKPCLAGALRARTRTAVLPAGSGSRQPPQAGTMSHARTPTTLAEHHPTAQHVPN